MLYVPTGNKVQQFPPHDYATTVPFTYTAPQTGNYGLARPYWTDTSDGKLAGVDYAFWSRTLASGGSVSVLGLISPPVAGINYSAPSGTTVSLKPAPGTPGH